MLIERVRTKIGRDFIVYMKVGFQKDSYIYGYNPSFYTFSYQLKYINKCYIRKSYRCTLVGRLCMLNCSDYWYLFPQRKFLVMNL
jgi:hypothetical protein